MGLVSKDRISSLPDHLISHILSFLHTKEAASTSVLSKRWRLLFAFVTNLDFHDSMYLRSKESRDESPTIFREFVDRVLSLQGNIKVNKFSLSCVNAVDQARTTSWIYNVLGRGVSDIELNMWDVEYGYPLPCKLFVSKTLVKLTLLGGECLSASFGMEDVFLPKLKTLSLQDLSFEESDVGFAKLISGCPVLEELALFNMWNVCSVSITTLKRLTFFCENKVWNPESVSFDTPNLVYLVYVDAIANEYPKVSFDSLVEAYVGLRLTKWWGTPQSFLVEGDEEEQMVGNATKFLMGICNVQILSLSPEALEVLAFCCEATPVFNNLIQLTIDSDSETGWESLPGLLKNCPNLETLVFKDLDHKRSVRCGNVCCCKRRENVPSCLSSSPVKVLKIYVHRHIDDDGMDIAQINHFLEKMTGLEELTVYYTTSEDRDVFELSKRLQNIPRIASSSKCKMQVISENLTLPKKGSAPRPREEKYTWFLNPLNQVSSVTIV